MSAFIINIIPQGVVIASDTLVYEKEDGKSLITCGFSSKTHYLPTVKSCAIIVGYSRLASDFMKFFHLDIIVKDIESLVEITAEHFLNKINVDDYTAVSLEGFEPDDLGGIDLVGFSEQRQIFVHYTIKVFRDRIDVNESDCNLKENEVMRIMHPRISSDKSESIDSSATDYVDASVKTLKQMYIDSLHEETQTVYLGGEIITTVMVSNPTFGCTFTSSYEFPDKRFFFDHHLTPLIESRNAPDKLERKRLLNRKIDIEVGRNLKTHLKDIIRELEQMPDDFDFLTRCMLVMDKERIEESLSK
ncbi:hypothetical protein [Pedobacter sp. Leaf170]|uniref:hypothetical protein n=1 Tax=Pedobacter sp. Leaf170 TaxID=2876558 RepID=UPI001E4B3287|nr:hypothetical protein [Pedobacter sp. Leaf170]